MSVSVLLILILNLFCGITYGVTFYPCSNQTPYKGEPIQIVTFSFNKAENTNKFELNYSGLKSILLRPEVSNKELVILSIAGPFRKGKSFFLSLVLQYLENDGGIDIHNLNLTHGFHWRGGSERDTQGMMMWSEPFCVKTKSGKEVAILLMDTQGAFDSQQTFGDTSTIFALSFLTSSIQLYNLQGQIQENDLQNLEVFATYGSEISGEKSYKPFQELLFLIRDWMNSDEYPYGEKGGQRYLENILKERSNQDEKLKQLRRVIKSGFSNLDCFLMPHPGLKVAKGNFTPADIEPEFINEINDFAAMVFNPENLVTKQIVDKNITGKLMFNFFDIYMKAFENKTNLKPETIHEATCRANDEFSLGNAKTFYSDEMEKKCSQILSINPSELQQFYVNVSKFTIAKFNNVIPRSCEESSKKYLVDLKKWMIEKYNTCSAQNQEKLIVEECRIKNEKAYSENISYYTRKMDEKCSQTHSVDPDELEKYNGILFDEIDKNFKQINQNKCGELIKNHLIRDYFVELKAWINEQFNICNESNHRKIVEECRIKNDKAYSESKSYYTQKMNEKCSHSVKPDQLKEYNRILLDEIDKKFKQVNQNICGEIIRKHSIRDYFGELKDWINGMFDIYEKENQERLIFEECRTKNENANNEMKSYYTQKMNEKCSQTNSVNPVQLKEYNRILLDEIDKKFKQVNQNICGEVIKKHSIRDYFGELKDWINGMFDIYEKKNQIKIEKERQIQIEKERQIQIEKERQIQINNAKRNNCCTTSCGIFNGPRDCCKGFMFKSRDRCGGWAGTIGNWKEVTCCELV